MLCIGYKSGFCENRNKNRCGRHTKKNVSGHAHTLVITFIFFFFKNFLKDIKNNFYARKLKEIVFEKIEILKKVLFVLRKYIIYQAKLCFMN